MLPWRRGKQPEIDQFTIQTYHVWLSEVMLQQTTVATVIPYFRKFVERWPTIQDLAASPIDDIMAEWAGLGYYSRARNLSACAKIVVSQYNGEFPSSLSELITLPGIGAYTAAAIAAIAFDQPETVIDGNVQRVITRVNCITTPLPKALPEIRIHARESTPVLRSGDYAQAIMDLGATICTPHNPHCQKCPWRENCCAYRTSCQTEIPKRRPPVIKPTRFGYLYIGRRADGAWLLEKRPSRGLLGRTIGWPGSHWESGAIQQPPCIANWRELPGEIHHVFSHFRLRLLVMAAIIDNSTHPEIGEFFDTCRFDPAHLPTLMRKAYDHAVTHYDFSMKNIV